jgi:uncharacterized SAM-binding protein YcdF (DUF218 family)
MESSLTYNLSSLLLPPTGLLVLALIGLLVSLRRRRAGLLVAAGCLFATLVLSTRYVANVLLRTLEPTPLYDLQAGQAQAVVILGSGRNLAAPEYGGQTLGSYGLERARYGVRLAKATALPLLVTGGRVEPVGRSEAELMQEIIEKEFAIPVRWVEAQSSTTWESARATAGLLRPAGVSRILLVTTALHMPRAALSFEAAGLAVTAAPTTYLGQRPFRSYQLVPDAEALRLSHLALREWSSILWYRLKIAAGAAAGSLTHADLPTARP